MSQIALYQPAYIFNLIAALAKRDLTAQYRDSVFGIAWVVLKPTLFMLVFSVVKGYLRIPTDGIPYPLFSFTGIALWLMVVSIITGATPSIMRNAGILRKMPTPRIVFPLSGLTISLCEFVFAMVPLAVLLIYFGYPLSWHALLAIPIAVVTAVFAFSVGLAIATISVFRNDLTQAIPYVLQAGLFLSPIIYPLSAVPDEHRALYSLNPLVGPLEGFRAVILDHRMPDLTLFVPIVVTICILLPVTLFCYHRVSRYFADFF